MNDAGHLQHRRLEMAALALQHGDQHAALAALSARIAIALRDRQARRRLAMGARRALSS